MTKKDLIVDFVALQGESGARFTEIQKFIYELNNPGIKYNSTRNRGYYCSGFSKWTYDGKDKRYLLTGDTCLVKLGELYFAKRDGKILHTSKRPGGMYPKIVWEQEPMGS
jgi:hypothetical protein